MELFGRLLFLAYAPIISAFLGHSQTFKHPNELAPKSDNYVVPNMNTTGQYFLSGSLVDRGADASPFSFFRDHCKCKVTESSPYGRVIVYCSSALSETPANSLYCPINKVLTETLIVNGSPFPTTSSLKSTSSATSPVPETEPNTPITISQIKPQENCTKIGINDAETQSHFPHIIKSNMHFLIIIGCQFTVIVMLVAYLLHQRRRRGAIEPPPMDILPLPSKEFAPPIEDVDDLTPRDTFQHPPPPPEAVYEVNPNYDEAPTVRRTKIAVYEDHKFDKNDPLTHQHNFYTKILHLEEGSGSVYSVYEVHE